MKWFYRVALLFAIGVVLAGCAEREAVVISEKDMPAPEALYERVSSDGAPGKTLTGMLNASATVPGERYTFKMAYAASRPDRLRLEDLSMLGLPDFVLTVRGTEVRMLLPRSGEFLVGTDSSERIRKMFPPGVKPSDVVGFLFGYPPPVPGYRQIKGSVDRNRYRLDVYAGGNWAQSIWLDPATGRLSVFEAADPRGSLLYRARFSDYAQSGALVIPGRIEIDAANGAVRLSLRSTDAELRDGDDALFRLEPPPDVPVKPLP